MMLSLSMPAWAYSSARLPDWPNWSTPSATRGAPKAPPRKARACEAASWIVTIGARRSAGGISASSGPPDGARAASTRLPRLAAQLVGQPELAEEHEQVHLGDAQLQVLAARPRLPAQQAGSFPVGVGRFDGRVDAHLVDPGAE